MINIYALPYFHAQIHVRLACLFLLCLGTTFIKLAIYKSPITGNKKESVVFGDLYILILIYNILLQSVVDKLYLSSLGFPKLPGVNIRPKQWCKN